MKRVNKNKQFWVIAYDITDDLRRSRLVRVLEKFGVRVNYSVFECMLTDIQLCKLREKLDKLILPSEDSIIYYPLCLACYSKIIYSPARYIKPRVVITV